MRPIVRLLPVAISGVVTGHLFVYKMFFPHQDHYHHAMESTGHGYFPVAIVVAIIFALLSFLAHVIIGYRDKRTGRQVIRPTYWSQAVLLIVLQLVIFTVMELAERKALLSPGLAFDFIFSPLFIAGLLYQVVVALVANLFIYGAEKLGSFLASHRHTGIKIVFMRIGQPETPPNLTPPAFNSRGPPAPQFI